MVKLIIALGYGQIYPAIKEYFFLNKIACVYLYNLECTGITQETLLFLYFGYCGKMYIT